MKIDVVTFTLVIMAASAFRTSSAQQPYCTPSTSGQQGKPLPALDMKAFTVEYRAIMGDKKYTMWAKESYSATLNKARMDLVKQGGLEQAIIMDYRHDTYFFYQYLDSNKGRYDCKIDALEEMESDNFHLFGYKLQKISGTRSIPHIVSANHVLSFAKEFGETYMGNDTIDGLDVDHWQSCVTWDDVNATFTLDYYFTTEDFKPRNSKTPSQIPVRAEVRGEITKQGRVPFHHTYEFLDFTAPPESLPPETFSLPDLMVCSGGSQEPWNQNAPSIPESMTYTLETVVQSIAPDTGKTTAKVSVSKLYVDAKRRMVREDRAHATSISDFNTGVEYLIDENGCTARAIDPSNVPSAANVDGVIRMKDREEIVFLKSQTLTFTGNKLSRGLLTEAFTGSLDDDKVVEAYFDPVAKIPLGLKVLESDKNTPTIYNIFGFERSSERLKEDAFHLKKCREAAGRGIHLLVTVRGELSSLDTSGELAVRKSLQAKVAEQLNISPLQLSTREFSKVKHFAFEEDYIHWYLTFHESVDLEHAKVENPAVKKLSSRFYTDVQSAIKNGVVQIDYPGRSWRTLPFTAIDVEYSWEHTQATIESDSLYSYPHIKDKCVKQFRGFELFAFKNSLHECAQFCTSNAEQPPCTMFQYTQSTRGCLLAWGEHRPDLVDTTGCDFYYQSYLHNFDVYFGTMLMKKNDAARRVAQDAEACARLCMEERAFSCQSFDFCGEEKRCQIYESHYHSEDTSPLSGEDLAGCKHYSRTVFATFRRYPSRDFSSPDAQELIVERATECPHLCSNMEEGCAAYSTCYTQNSAGESAVKCKLLPLAKARDAEYDILDRNCFMGSARGTGDLRQVSLPDVGRSSNGGGGTSYSGAAMFGLALAMLLAGILLALLTVVLLRRFNIWEGF